MISLLVTQISKRSFISFATLLLALTGSANIIADDAPGIPTIYATTVTKSESVTLLGVNADGSLILGMSESHLNGITASGLRGITASGLHGITASGLHGITASGLHGITASGLRNGTTQAPIVVFEEIPLIALGRLTERSDGEASINVLGQDVIFDDQTAVISFDANEPLPTVAEGKDAIKLLNVDDYIAVAGEIMGPAKYLGTVIVKLPKQYLDGISLAYVRNLTAEIKADVGIAQSGSTEIDYTGSLYNSELVSTSSGSVAEYFGFTATKKKMIAAYGHIISKK